MSDEDLLVQLEEMERSLRAGADCGGGEMIELLDEAAAEIRVLRRAAEDAAAIDEASPAFSFQLRRAVQSARAALNLPPR